MTAPPDEEFEDGFDTWMRSFSGPDPSQALRERCRLTAPCRPRVVPIWKRTLGLTLKGSWAARVARIGAAAAAILAILILWSLFSGPQSVFAQAVEKFKNAPVIHWKETFRDPEKFPGELREAEYWFVQHVGRASVSKKNGVLWLRCVDREGVLKHWNAEANQVTVEPSNSDYSNWLWISSPDRLLTYEAKAKEQGRRIEVENLKKAGREIRHVRISNVRLQGDGSGAGHVLNLLEADIDTSSNLLLRVFIDERMMDGNLLDGTPIQWAHWNPIREDVFDYPDPKNFDSSLFDFTIPPDAQTAPMDAN